MGSCRKKVDVSRVSLQNAQAGFFTAAHCGAVILPGRCCEKLPLLAVSQAGLDLASARFPFPDWRIGLSRTLRSLQRQLPDSSLLLTRNVRPLVTCRVLGAQRADPGSTHQPEEERAVDEGAATCSKAVLVGVGALQGFLNAADLHDGLHRPEDFLLRARPTGPGHLSQPYVPMPLSRSCKPAQNLSGVWELLPCPQHSGNSSSDGVERES